MDIKIFILLWATKPKFVKEYFLGYRARNSDFTVDLSNGDIEFHKEQEKDWRVTMIDTGISSMTGGRVKRLEKYIENQTFMLTYGDGLADIDINELLKFHKSHGKMVTMTAVHPSARFGELQLDGCRVVTFEEKPQTTKGWINGGFCVIQPEFLNLIENDDTILERRPLEQAAEMGELMAYQHNGFWQCMDTKRDHDNLEKMWSEGEAPWIV